MANVRELRAISHSDGKSDQVDAEKLARYARLDPNILRTNGATHAINSNQTSPVEAIRDITDGGVDYSLDTSGKPRALHQTIEALGSLGTCGIVGAEPLGTEVSFDVSTVIGCGSSSASTKMPAGQYPLTITGISDSLTHSVTYDMTVN
jgi:Zinc-binding dehydrogenase